MIVNTFNAGTIGHIFQYEVTDERYTDNTPKINFYNSTVKDTVTTHDSINFSKIKKYFLLDQST